MMLVETSDDISHPDFPRAKCVVMIGINFVGQQQGRLLAGCHNDVLNMKQYPMDRMYILLKRTTLYNIVLLMDNKKNTQPTNQNIMDIYAQIGTDSETGDILVVSMKTHTFSLLF